MPDFIKNKTYFSNDINKLFANTSFQSTLKILLLKIFSKAFIVLNNINPTLYGDVYINQKKKMYKHILFPATTTFK